MIYVDNLSEMVDKARKGQCSPDELLSIIESLIFAIEMWQGHSELVQIRPTFWMSSKKMTVFCTIDDKCKIVSCSPIVKKFIGQDFSNLIKWMDKHGGLKMSILIERSSR